MRIILDYKCSNGHIFEKFTEPEPSISCPTCGAESNRIVTAANVRLDPISGDFPSATRSWAKMRQEKIKQERKAT
jgi:predicted nucleic acid-binding Zn ribbon protein